MTPASRTGASVFLAVCTCGLSACGPLNVLSRDGVTGSSETSLGWSLVIVACAVVLIVAVLVPTAWVRSRGRRPHDDAVFAGSPGLPWITWGGVIIPAIVLVAAILF